MNEDYFSHKEAQIAQKNGEAIELLARFFVAKRI